MLPRSAPQRLPQSSRLWSNLTVAVRGIALATGCYAVEARATEPVRLEWVRLEGAGSCIDAAELEARVERRLGSNPFDSRASRSIEGVARRTGNVWRAQIAVRGHRDDANPPLRDLESEAADCESLSNAVVLAVALAVDPAAAFSDGAVKGPPPPPAVETPKTSASAPAVAGSEVAPASRADLALESQIGVLPRASLGVGFGAVAVLTPNLGLGLRARTFPEVQVSGNPSYAVGLTALTLELCAGARPATAIDLRACAGPSLGLLHAAVLTGDRTQPGQRASLAAELGLDAAFALTRSLALVLGARAAAPVTRYRFTLEGSDDALFEQSAVAGMARLGLELRFDAHWNHDHR
jgi:hypothetical protein